MSPHRNRLIALALLVALLLALALTWQFGPARLQPQQLLSAARELDWGLQFGLFVLAGCLAVPLSLLVLLAVLVLGPAAGAATSLLAGTAIGLLSFAAGALLGRQAVAQLAGPRVQAINALVQRRGLLAVFIVRLVPAAPYAVVNLVLGATPLHWPVFLLGNLLGMLPMVLITAALAPEILAQLQQPSESGWLALGAVIALIAVVTWLARRWAKTL